MQNTGVKIEVFKGKIDNEIEKIKNIESMLKSASIKMLKNWQKEFEIGRKLLKIKKKTDAESYHLC